MLSLEVVVQLLQFCVQFRSEASSVPSCVSLRRHYYARANIDGKRTAGGLCFMQLHTYSYYVRSNGNNARLSKYRSYQLRA